jgi:hypothetical protein
MFFEIGTVSGGLAFGLVAQAFGKRASFGAAVGLCLIGLWLLRTRVAPAERLPAVAPVVRPTFVPVAGD